MTSQRSLAILSFFKLLLNLLSVVSKKEVVISSVHTVLAQKKVN